MEGFGGPSQRHRQQGGYGTLGGLQRKGLGPDVGVPSPCVCPPRSGPQHGAGRPRGLQLHHQPLVPAGADPGAGACLPTMALACSPVPPKAGGPHPPTDASPQAPRHSHVAVCWRDALVLSGGELAGGALAHDVWVFDPFRGGWRELQPQNGTRPPGLAGHAAALVDDWLYIFGGGGQGGAGDLGSLRAVGSGGLWGLGGGDGARPSLQALEPVGRSVGGCGAGYQGPSCL